MNYLFLYTSGTQILIFSGGMLVYTTKTTEISQIMFVGFKNKLVLNFCIHINAYTFQFRLLLMVKQEIS